MAHYFRNDEFDPLVDRVRANPNDTQAWDRIAEMLYLLIDGTIKRLQPHERFHSIEDIRQDVMVTLLDEKVFGKLETGRNSFSFLTNKCYWTMIGKLRKDVTYHTHMAEWYKEAKEGQQHELATE